MLYACKSVCARSRTGVYGGAEPLRPKLLFREMAVVTPPPATEGAISNVSVWEYSNVACPNRMSSPSYKRE